MGGAGKGDAGTGGGTGGIGADATGVSAAQAPVAASSSEISKAGTKRAGWCFMRRFTITEMMLVQLFTRLGAAVSTHFAATPIQ